MSHTVPEFLTTSNYDNWRACVKSYLLANDLWDVVESSAEPPTEEAEFKAWRKKNFSVLYAIHISCYPDTLALIADITSAKDCWDTLAELNKPKPLEPPPLPPTPPPPPIQGNQWHCGQKKLHKCECCTNAIKKGDMQAVKDFIRQHPDSVRKPIGDFGRTALHLATLIGNVKIVEALVELMSEEDLKLGDGNRETALILAAVSGSTRIAEIMVKKYPNLVTVGVPERDLLPVTVACEHGHMETTRYLYSVTPFDEFVHQEKASIGSRLLLVSISRKSFDISLDMLDRCPSLATTLNNFGFSPIQEFSGQSEYFPSGTPFVFWKQWIYNRIHVELPPARLSDDVRISISQNDRMQQGNFLLQGLGWLRSLALNFLEYFGLKQIYDTKLTHAYALKILPYMTAQASTIDINDPAIDRVYDAFFLAIRRGVIEVIIDMIKTNPNLLIVVNGMNSRGLLMTAAEYRQENVFSLVYVLGNVKHMMISSSDHHDNNLLHAVADIAPPRRLARISGAALQMQRELQWYKEVESIVNPYCKESLDKLMQMPGEIFSLKHRDMMVEGEKWMKETATSSTVVGALIVTIMFTAAFTVPGGNDGGTGFPIFLNQKAFTTFLISDAISLFASSTSVMVFLGILTARYAEEDFLKSLPTKLIIGLSTLFISIAAMMVAFCATIVLMLREELNLVLPNRSIG